MKEVFLVRHAESLYEPGVPDAHRPLSARGRQQALELAALLERLGIEEIHTSPYARCLATIAPLAARLGLRATEVHDLRERTFTARDIDDWAGTWKTAWMDPDFAFADGESGRAARARMHQAIMAIVTNTRARTLAISSHGNVIALLLNRIDRAFTFEHACAIRNPDVVRLTFDERLVWDARFRLAGLDAFATRHSDASGNTAPEADPMP